MSKEVVERWYNSLPRIEREGNEPLIALEGFGYSARGILQQVRMGTETGRKLQKVIEKRLFSRIEDKIALAITRLEGRLAKLPPEFRIVFGAKMYSSQEMLREVHEGTKVGRAFVEAEVRRVEEMLK